MMKHWILMLAAALALGGCQSNGGSTEKAVQAVDNQPADVQEITQRVEEIYGTVFKEYNREDSLRNLDQLDDDPGAMGHMQEFIDNYCSSEWRRLMRQIDEIDSVNDGQGYWEADFWIMGQDWHQLSISDVKVQACTGSEAVVELKLHNFDAAKPVTLKMVKEDGAWRIDDFIDNEVDLDWKQSMQQYVTEETDKNKK